jgi:hypothetical protein
VWSKVLPQYLAAAAPNSSLRLLELQLDGEISMAIERAKAYERAMQGDMPPRYGFVVQFLPFRYLK